MDVRSNAMRSGIRPVGFDEDMVSGRCILVNFPFETGDFEQVIYQGFASNTASVD